MLLGVTKIDQNFEQKFWDFDNSLIEKVQYFHLRSKKGPFRKVCGGFLAVLDHLMNFAFALELWMIIVLVLTMYQ
jgi:hypothetical protein